MNTPKQVIVVRKDLNMSEGKLAAQVDHASMSVLLDRLHRSKIDYRDYFDFSGYQYRC